MKSAENEVQGRIEEGRERRRRKRSVEEKRRIVEESLAAGATVAEVARAHGIGASQLSDWRKKYGQGQLKERESVLLAVRVSDGGRNGSARESGTIHIRLAKGEVHVEGAADGNTLREILEGLLR
jgi:transposase